MIHLQTLVSDSRSGVIEAIAEHLDVCTRRTEIAEPQTSALAGRIRDCRTREVADKRMPSSPPRTEFVLGENKSRHAHDRDEAPSLKGRPTARTPQ